MRTQPSALCIYFSLIAERLCCRAENWVFLVSVVQCITNLHAVHANNPTLSVEANPVRTIEAEELTVVLTGTNLPYRTPVVSFSSFKTLPPLVYDHTCVLLGLFLFSFPQISPQSEMKLAAVRSVPHRSALLYSRSDILRTVSRLTHLTIDEMTLTVSSSQCPFLLSLHFTSDLGCFCADTEGLCSLSFYIKRAQMNGAVTLRFCLSPPFWTQYPISFPVIWCIWYLSNWFLKKGWISLDSHARRHTHTCSQMNSSLFTIKMLILEAY